MQKPAAAPSSASRTACAQPSPRAAPTICGTRINHGRTASLPLPVEGHHVHRSADLPGATGRGGCLRPGPAAASPYAVSHRIGGPVRPQRTTTDKGKEVAHSLPLSTYSAPGVLRQDPGRAAESPAEARTCGYVRNSRSRELLSTCGSRGASNPVGPAERLQARDAEAQAHPLPDSTEQLAEIQLR
jgi:hypothetical protein